MIVTIHQPDFLPWLGFFDRWRMSDLYVVLDDVQFNRRGWQHRDKIKTDRGLQWLTVPVKKKGRYMQFLKDVEINNEENWRRKQLNAIMTAYKEAPEFDRVFKDLKRIMYEERGLLIDLNLDLLKYCADRLGINTPFVFSSSFHENSKGTKRLVNLVKAVGGSVYLTGFGSKDYLEVAVFRTLGIKVKWRKYSPPVYPQLHGKFEPMISVLDFLMMATDPTIVFPRGYT